MGEATNFDVRHYFWTTDGASEKLIEERQTDLAFTASFTEDFCNQFLDMMIRPDIGTPRNLSLVSDSLILAFLRVGYISRVLQKMRLDHLLKAISQSGYPEDFEIVLVEMERDRSQFGFYINKHPIDNTQQLINNIRRNSIESVASIALPQQILRFQYIFRIKHDVTFVAYADSIPALAPATLNTEAYYLKKLFDAEKFIENPNQGGYPDKRYLLYTKEMGMFNVHQGIFEEVTKLRARFISYGHTIHTSPFLDRFLAKNLDNDLRKEYLDYGILIDGKTPSEVWVQYGIPEVIPYLTVGDMLVNEGFMKWAVYNEEEKETVEKSTNEKLLVLFRKMLIFGIGRERLNTNLWKMLEGKFGMAQELANFCVQRGISAGLKIIVLGTGSVSDYVISQESVRIATERGFYTTLRTIQTFGLKVA